jgi:hypothetical protein
MGIARNKSVPCHENKATSNRRPGIVGRQLLARKGSPERLQWQHLSISPNQVWTVDLRRHIVELRTDPETVARAKENKASQTQQSVQL